MKYDNLNEYLEQMQYYLSLYKYFKLNNKDDKAKKIALEIKDLMFVQQQEEEDNI